MQNTPMNRHRPHIRQTMSVSDASPVLYSLKRKPFLMTAPLGYVIYLDRGQNHAIPALDSPS